MYKITPEYYEYNRIMIHYTIKLWICRNVEWEVFVAEFSCPLALPIYIANGYSISSYWKQQDQLVNSNLSNTDFESIVASSGDSIKSTEKLVSWTYFPNPPI